MSTTEVPASAEERRRFSGVSWPDYVAFSDGLGERHIRVTYDQGEMEVMTVSPEHERSKHLLVLLLSVIAE
jgi:hypothetical protein